MTYPYGTETTVVGGCIRIDPDKGVYLHENSTHASIGIEKVCIDGAFLRVDFTGSGPVVSATVTADETVGGFYGIIVGASGGVGNVMLRFFDTKTGTRLDMSKKSDYDKVSSAVSNVWLNVVHLKSAE